MTDDDFGCVLPGGHDGRHELAERATLFRRAGAPVCPYRFEDERWIGVSSPAIESPRPPELDLDWHGDAYDRCIESTKHVVTFRRFGPQINFGVVPSGITLLTADEAEDVAANLYAAARAARAHEAERPS